MRHLGLDHFLEFLMLFGQLIHMSLQRHVLHLSQEGMEIRTPKKPSVTVSFDCGFQGVND
jgi:hypothetical protein